MLKIKNLLLFTILLCSVTSCRTPPDVFAFETYDQRLVKDATTGHTMLMPSPYCVKHIDEPSCCHGVSIVRGREVYVGEKEEHFWKGKSCSQLIRESVHLPAVESFAPLSTFTINECKRNKCSDKITPFKVKLDGLTSIGDVIKNANP